MQDAPLQNQGHLLSDTRALGVAQSGQRVCGGDRQGLAEDGGVLQSVQRTARAFRAREPHHAVALVAAQVHLRSCHASVPQSTCQDDNCASTCVHVM